MNAGENTLPAKLEQPARPWTFAVRFLEPGAAVTRIQEIGSSSITTEPTSLAIKTDIDAERASQDEVTVQVVAASNRAITICGGEQ